ncbi:MAG TPA: RHS repeat-associated core domain-containing protein [Bacilli bacterium]|nr:RHS repeat-associated core domain-containing protein [Bacilli bacterium]
MTNAQQETTKYTYDPKGQLTAVTDPMEHTTTYSYDPFGHLESQTDANGNTYSFTYDELGRLSSLTDPENNVINYEYDLDTLTTKIIYPGDRADNTAAIYADNDADDAANAPEVSETYRYDQAGNLVEHIDTRKNKFTYTYDALNHLTKVITPQGETSYDYDVLGQLTAEIDATGKATRYGYDKLGRLETVTDKLSNVTKYIYDPKGVYVEELLPNEKKNRVEYNAVGQVVLTQDAEGAVTRYEYDEWGNLSKKINPRLDEATYTYDNVGRLLSIVDPLKNTTSFTYDKNGNLLTRTNTLDQTWAYEYDDANRLIKLTDPMLQVSKFDYDKNGNLTYYLDPMLRETKFHYNARNLMDEKIDPAEYKTTYAYDGEGNLISETDHDGVSVKYGYDALNRLTSKTDGEGNSTTLSYDVLGNVESVTDGNLYTTTYDYDALGHLTSVVDPESGITSYRYDKMGNLLEQKDAKLQSTLWTYDGVGRMLSEQTPDGALTKFGYDAMGNLTSRIDAAGKLTSYSYDERQLLTGITYPSGSKSAFGYDKIGRLTSSSNPTASESYVYDDLNRVTSMTNSMNGTSGTLSKTTKFDYDKVGNRTAITDADGLQIKYTYDNRDNITSMTDPDGLVTSYTYNAHNQVTNITGGDLTSTAIAYDHSGRKQQITTRTQTGLLSSYAYTYDGVGNILTQTEEDGAVTSYTYDKLDRLTEATYPKDKIETIRNTYYTPPLDKQYPDGADGSGDVDTDAPTFPDVTSPQLNVPFPNAGGKGNSGRNAGSGKDKDPASSDPTPSTGTSTHGGSSSGSTSGGNTNGNSSNGGNGSHGNSGSSSTSDTSKGNSGNSTHRNGSGGNSDHGNNNGNGHGNNGDKGNNGHAYAYGKNKKRYGGDTPLSADSYSVELGYPENYVPEDPDFFLNPVSHVTYTYDKVGNRTSMTDDYGIIEYSYDKNNRLLEADGDTYTYDILGNLTSRTTPYGPVTYSYNDDNQLSEVAYIDGTFVRYFYDAYGRKAKRQEQYYDLNDPGASMGQGAGSDNNPGQGHAYGHNKNNPNGGIGTGNGQGSTKSNGKSSNKSNAGGNGKGKGNASTAHTSGGNGGSGNNSRISNYHLKQEITHYLYDGNNLLSEYNADGDILAEYYRGANDQIVARQMFGFQGRKDQGYLGNLRDRGHKLFYHYDATGNVTDLTDHLGSTVLKYRYDAFGGVFTQLWNPYNQVGLTGKSYDIKASLMDYSTRWYSPAVGRFTTQDTWLGNAYDSQSLNRYIYVTNNPINFSDPTGHSPCRDNSGGGISCGYDPNPDNWGSTQSDIPSNGGNTPPEPTPLPGPDDEQPGWMKVLERQEALYHAAQDAPVEFSTASLKHFDYSTFDIQDQKQTLVYGILPFFPEQGAITGKDYRFEEFHGDELMKLDTRQLSLRLELVSAKAVAQTECLNMAAQGINIAADDVCRNAAAQSGYGPADAVAVTPLVGGMVEKTGDKVISTISSFFNDIKTRKVQENDVVPYRPSNAPLENHHGVLDVWAKNNIPNYISRGADTPTIALTPEQHNATKAVYRDWLFEKTGKKVGGKVDWKAIAPQEMQLLSERKFDSAGVSQSARQDYYRALHQYIYRE